MGSKASCPHVRPEFEGEMPFVEALFLRDLSLYYVSFRENLIKLQKAWLISATGNWIPFKPPVLKFWGPKRLHNSGTSWNIEYKLNVSANLRITKLHVVLPAFKSIFCAFQSSILSHIKVVIWKSGTATTYVRHTRESKSFYRIATVKVYKHTAVNINKSYWPNLQC